jgi:hypothetical protein
MLRLAVAVANVQLGEPVMWRRGRGGKSFKTSAFKISQATMLCSWDISCHRYRLR